jgi:lysyl-tRNA synthetase class 2
MSDDQNSNTPDPNQEPGALEAARREKLRKISEMGIDPWGSRFDDRTPIGDVRARAGEIRLVLESGEEIEPLDPATQPEDFNYRQWLADQGKGDFKGPKVRVAGRIILQRPTGKLIFVNLRDRTGDIQLFIGKNQVGEDNWSLAKCFDLADIVGADGELRRTKTGELTIFVERLHYFCKSIETPPEKHHGLTDPELLQRMRYLDLTYSEDSLTRFVNRTKIVQSVRNTLNSDGFLEIEGPTLHTIAGGAAARPFITHHNTLDMDLTMRIALELHLKRLLVGGMERVYELGRVYRNEGISPKHNPEFTMLEVYQAYGNYETMMDLTERVIIDALDAISSEYKVTYGEAKIDFTPPFAREKYDDLFAKHTGVDPTDEATVKTLAEKLELDTAGKHPDVVKNEVFEEKVEGALVGPIFVIDYPASICPLTKRSRENPGIAERFELFVRGMEIANAYTELNDPDLQEQLFTTQLEGMAEEDSMARMDHDFIRALRHGMPPAGGLGIGIDRLVMLLTNSQSIRDVILFPLLRSEG